MSGIIRSVVFIVVACLGLASLPTPAAAIEEPSAIAALPPVIQVESLLRTVTARMLEKSPTFKRQCDLIGGSGSIVVKVRVVPAPRNSFTRATTTFRRYTSGITIADVEIPAASRIVELLAHEFEHIAEYVEGVDLKSMARARPDEAFRLRDGSFETNRAVQAGRAAVNEVERR
jgi:hypothetical protein